jgi:glycine/D-amino acid oxidase-like deaminating enzyme
MRRMEVDVLVVGAGITGLTTAYLLKQAGLRVAVVDQKRIGSGETSRTTAHVTFVTDVRLHELVSRFGKKAAQACWGVGHLDPRGARYFWRRAFPDQVSCLFHLCSPGRNQINR